MKFPLRKGGGAVGAGVVATSSQGEGKLMLPFESRIAESKPSPLGKTTPQAALRWRSRSRHRLQHSM